MKKALPEYVLLINPIASPFQMALYRDGKIENYWHCSGFVSDRLPEEIDKVFGKFKIRSIIYANGPGSFMAVKLTYIMLRTVEIVNGIPFYGCSAFSLNGGKPLKAAGNLYFVKEKENIITQTYREK